MAATLRRLQEEVARYRARGAPRPTAETIGPVRVVLSPIAELDAAALKTLALAIVSEPGLVAVLVGGGDAGAGRRGAVGRTWRRRAAPGAQAAADARRPRRRAAGTGAGRRAGASIASGVAAIARRRRDDSVRAARSRGAYGSAGPGPA